MSDNRDKKQQNAFDALEALSGGSEPAPAPAPETPPAKPAPKKPAVPSPAANEPVVEIPKVPKRPTQPPAGSGRPDTPPAIPKAPKATPARAASPATAAKPRAAAAPAQRTRRIDPVKVKRRIAARQQAEAWRQTAFPILLTIGLLLIVLGIVGLISMPSKSYDRGADTDNWDTDPHSPLGTKAVRFFIYASFPIGAVVILGGILLVIQASGLKKMREADELALYGPPAEEQE